MPNIKISDLEPITLPAVGDETFFEVQAVAAGQDVSRKISLDEIVSTTGLDASFLTVSANAQLPNERVLTEGTGITFVDTGPNGTLTISATAAGVTFPLLAPDGSAAAPSYSFTNDPGAGMFLNALGELSLAADGVEIARAINGANLQFALAQSGSSTVPELTSLADPDTGFGWTGVNTTRWIGGGTRAWNFSTVKFFSQFSNGGAIFNRVSQNDVPTLVPDHSDDNTGIGSTGNDVLTIVAGGFEGLRISEASSQIIQTNSNQVGLTASVTQTQAGGLPLLSSYNEVATVGTTGDALTAFAVVAGTRLIVINNGANDLQLFPAVGDDIGAGVDTAITIVAGDIGIFIGRDATNWDTLYNAAPSPAGGGANVVVGTVDGQVVIWDVGNNQYEPVSDSVIRINPVSPPTSPLGRISIAGSSTSDVRKAGLVVNIGASVSTVWSTNKGGGTQEGFYSRSELNGSTVFHNWGFWDDANQTGIDNFTIFDNGQFLFERTFHMEERAAALASIAGRGQVWVRDDVPNVLMYTDDAGTDFVLNAGGGGGVLPAGTIGDSSLKWDGISAWVEETQVAFPGGATGIKVFDATLADFITMGHNGTTAGFSVNGATTEVIFGQGGGPTVGWKFNEKVRFPDGSAAVPGIAFTTGGTDGFFRNGFPGVSVTVTGVEQQRITNANTEVYSDVFILAPNIGTDRVSMAVSPPTDVNDLRFLLTSLTDIHWRGTGGERFVLEEYNLAMFEKAAAPGDVAGTGQFWVRDDVPNTPMFTDDAGTDFVLNAGGGAVFPEFQFAPNILENPNNADWTVNALAPALADSNNAGLTVRLFDDTTEEGVGFQFEVPAAASNIIFTFRSRAETAPGIVNTVGLDIYNRGIPDNAAVQAWSAATQLTDISIPTNEFFQEDSQTIALGTLGLTAGELTQFELVRTTPTGGTDLTGDWALGNLKVSFS